MQQYAQLLDDMRALDDDAIAVVCACAAERFAPVYADFCEKHSFGDVASFRTTLDRVWSRLMGAEIDLPDALDLEALVPHAEDYPTIEATLAQDAVILLDAALAWTIRREDRTVEWMEYALEGLRMVAADRETGNIDPGDQPLTPAMEERIANDPMIVEEFALEQEDVERLKGDVSAARREEMRQYAAAHAWRLKAIVG